ncbi:MAG: bifunctional alpha,alpha-trehalose-phosphate synthase (UDP-forming)/trehalose-phosphatase [Verrucomicrobiota bacterium JB023]|nr:bifunctional alpha,alpha-trehalose-phosphate synthase (UDP-forming)/trehalose-phosphatase [Verrucomicrobiota bacterium JB023]
MILVSNRLPVRQNEDGSLERTSGGLASALSSLCDDPKTRWVGWAGSYPQDEATKNEIKDKLAELSLVPVFLEEEKVGGYYDGFANSCLWPLLHGMLDRTVFDKDWFADYQDVNEVFAQSLAESAAEGETVWIHDYHLFLLPMKLRALRPDLNIGFFLHTPFPTSEVFRCLPERKELLEGLLDADLLGFHTFNYLRHFRSSVLRVLGEESDFSSIRREHHVTRLGVFPIGHNASLFAEARQSEEFQEAMERFAEIYHDKKIVLSVERLDYTKGIPQKLACIRKFIEDSGEMAEETVFVLIAVPSRQGVPEYDELTEEVQREVGSINGALGEIGRSPIEFIHGGVPMPELTALYALADVCMVTPLIDGMNLVAKEYIDCKREEVNARPGALVLSEFAGAAPEMSQAILANPYHIEESVETLIQALKMSDEEKWERTRAMQGRLSKNRASMWAKSFLKSLAQPAEPDTESLSSASLQILEDSLHKQLAEEKPLALFLDYDGTLRGFTQKPEDAVPDEELLNCLETLAGHPHIKVAVVSGRPESFLQPHFGHLPIALVGEHGYRWRPEPDQPWEDFLEQLDLSWKDIIRPMLEDVEKMTPGTHLEEKKSALVWHYRQAESEFGSWQAHSLLENLTPAAANLPVRVSHGHKIVEVSSQAISKGVAVERLIQRWEPFSALSAGDDQTDETMFSIDHQLEDFHTIKIGHGGTAAHYRASRQRLRELLFNLAGN